MSLPATVPRSMILAKERRNSTDRNLRASALGAAPQQRVSTTSHSPASAQTARLPVEEQLRQQKNENKALRSRVSELERRLEHLEAKLERERVSKLENLERLGRAVDESMDYAMQAMGAQEQFREAESSRRSAEAEASRLREELRQCQPQSSRHVPSSTWRQRRCQAQARLTGFISLIEFADNVSPPGGALMYHPLTAASLACFTIG